MKHLTSHTLDGEAGAIVSDCEQYRYRLWREWDASRRSLGFIMLNPPTTRSTTRPSPDACSGLAGKYGRVEVVNLFPLRSTDPAGLLTHPDPPGREEPQPIQHCLQTPSRLSGWSVRAYVV